MKKWKNREYKEVAQGHVAIKIIPLYIHIVLNFSDMFFSYHWTCFLQKVDAVSSGLHLIGFWLIEVWLFHKEVADDSAQTQISSLLSKK